MNLTNLKHIGIRAEKCGLRLDLFLVGLEQEIKNIKRQSIANGDDGMYGARILDTFCSLINEEIEELFQIKYDINQSLE